MTTEQWRVRVSASHATDDVISPPGTFEQAEASFKHLLESALRQSSTRLVRVHQGYAELGAPEGFVTIRLEQVDG